MKQILTDCILTRLWLCVFWIPKLFSAQSGASFSWQVTGLFPYSQMCAKELLRMQGPSEMFALFCLSNHYVFVCEWQWVYVNLCEPYIPEYTFL